MIFRRALRTSTIMLKQVRSSFLLLSGSFECIVLADSRLQYTFDLPDQVSLFLKHIVVTKLELRFKRPTNLQGFLALNEVFQLLTLFIIIHIANSAFQLFQGRRIIVDVFLFLKIFLGRTSEQLTQKFLIVIRQVIKVSDSKRLKWPGNN